MDEYTAQLERLADFGIDECEQLLSGSMNPLLSKIHSKERSSRHWNIQTCKSKLIDIVFGHIYQQLDIYNIDPTYFQHCIPTLYKPTRI